MKADLWKEEKDPVTGRSSLEDHKLRTIWVSCPKNECHFVLTDPGKRECTCEKCGGVQSFVLGIQNLVDGKIISMR